jgi:hypothetical protein
MSNMVQNDLTQAGVALIAKAMGGQVINFTKLTVGDGELDGQNISQMTDVVNRVIDIPIAQVKPQDENSILIGGSFSNNDLEEGFFYRELGLYAIDPDEGEILYAYGNAADNADFISPAAEGTLSEKMVSLIIYVGKGTVVTVTLASGVYVTREEFEALQAEVQKIREDLFGVEV